MPAALCLVFLLGVMSAVLLMCLHAQEHHYACEPDCVACAQIAEALSLAKQAGMMTVIVAFATLSLFRARMPRKAFTEGWPDTPVALKTRMNN